jgi:hypothetical protein
MKEAWLQSKNVSTQSVSYADAIPETHLCLAVSLLGLVYR